MNCIVRLASVWELGWYKCRPLTGTVIQTLSVDPLGGLSFYEGGTIWIITITF